MNQKTDILRKVDEKGFAVTEWKLYTDTHPNDDRAVAALHRAAAEYKAAREEYLNEYGPLACTDMSNTPWIADPWPWDYEGCGC